MFISESLEQFLPICLADHKIIYIQFFHYIIKSLLVYRFFSHSIDFKGLIELIKFILNDDMYLLLKMLSRLRSSLDF